MKYILLLGRVLFAWIFIEKSFCHFSGEMIDHAAGAGMPMASIFVPISGVLAFLGGVSILLGYKARVGAWLLVIFLLPVTFVMHRFWEFNGTETVLLHNLCFMKNLALVGASLMITYFGSGPLSLKE